MKDNLKKLSYLLLPILLFSCSKFENLAEDIPVYIDTDLLHNSLTVQFLNIDEVWENRPQDITVEIVGKDKDKVYSLLGERRINVADNHLKIGIRKNQIPTTDNPLEFSVIAKAPGHAPAVKKFCITGDEANFSFMYMDRKEQSIAGVEKISQTINAEAGGIKESVLFKADFSGETAVSATVEIKEGTKFSAKTGLPVRNQLAISMTAMDNFSETADHLFPGGFSGAVANSAGDLLEENLFFAPICFGSMEASTGTSKARFLSEPMTVSVDISSDYINPKTGEPIAAGDVVDFWGMNLDNIAWSKLGTGQAVMTSTGLRANISTGTIPDFWAMTISASGDLNVEFAINSDVQLTDRQAYYYVIIRQTSARFSRANQIIYEGYNQLYNDEKIRLMNLTDFGFGTFEVYESKYDCNGGKLLSRHFFAWQPFDFTSPQKRDFSIVNLYVDNGVLNNNDKFEIAVDVFGVCSGGDTVLRTVPSLDLQYSNIDCGHGEFELLGRLKSGKGSTTALIPGKRYNFFFEHADLTRCLNDFPITRQDTTYRIESDVYDFYEDVSVDFDTLNNRIDLQWHNVRVPDKACDEYRRYY